MDLKRTAREVLENVGGEENIISIMSCFTRVRVELKDKTKVDEKKLKEADGCQGVNWVGNTVQIIFGGRCNDVYDELEKIVHITETEANGEKSIVKKQSVWAVVIDYIANSIQPVVPILIASGFLQSVLAMLNYLDIDTTTYTYQVLNSIGQAGYYFLPIFLAFAAAKKLRINPYLGALVGAVMVYPAIIEAGSAGGTASFLGVPVTLVSYASSITPILISMPVVMWINKLAKKISPKVLSSLLIPIITMILSIPVVLIVTGPVATWIGNGLCGVVSFIFTKMSVVGGLLIGDDIVSRKEYIRQQKISEDGVYQYLLYFDKLYDKFTDMEKKEFMNSFVERVDIYEDEQPNGRFLKHIKFKFPVFFDGEEIQELSWDNETTVETIVLIQKKNS